MMIMILLKFVFWKLNIVNMYNFLRKVNHSTLEYLPTCGMDSLRASS